jgi:1-deoxy-D-xylulose 5-phosphate reductoisomerase
LLHCPRVRLPDAAVPQRLRFHCCSTADTAVPHEPRLQIEGLAAGTNVKLLNEQIRKFNPKIVSVANDKVLTELKEALSGWDGKMPELVCGEQGLIDVAKCVPSLLPLC